jgi:endonuclease/exonuclease/phosphatase family metal-dependent hydrolase
MAQNMKIFSWNILYRNQELDRAFQFIAESDFDIFCLQEVSEQFLKRLQTLPYFIAFRTDVERLLKEGTEHNFIVTLSKHPIKAQGEIPYPDYWPLLPLRTRLFVHSMPSRFFSKIRNRGGLYADVTLDGGMSLRVFNLHLVLAQPLWRLKEFELAMAARDHTRPTIVCGDFNTIEAPHISILNWILGGRAHDSLFYGRERTHIEQRFVEHELHNPLRNTITHPLSRSQLDHILVSHSFSIKNAAVLPDRFGSDHHPIRVETV